MGFAPVFNKDSKLLILGSFPSVKSREIAFYYGNKQNRFWRTVCGFFQEDVPESIEGKKEFLLRRKIALWDIAVSCEIEGSSDASLRNAEIANLSDIFKQTSLKKIILNGALAYKLFLKKYENCGISYEKLPSTSPANPTFDAEIWRRSLYDVFGIS